MIFTLTVPDFLRPSRDRPPKNCLHACTGFVVDCQQILILIGCKPMKGGMAGSEQANDPAYPRTVFSRQTPITNVPALNQWCNILLCYDMNHSMTISAKLFMSGRSQAIRLPAKLRLSAKVVLIEQIGDGLWIRPEPEPTQNMGVWLQSFYDNTEALPEDFLAERHDAPAQARDWVLD